MGEFISGFYNGFVVDSGYIHCYGYVLCSMKRLGFNSMNSCICKTVVMF